MIMTTRVGCRWAIPTEHTLLIANMVIPAIRSQNDVDLKCRLSLNAFIATSSRDPGDGMNTIYGIEIWRSIQTMLSQLNGLSTPGANFAKVPPLIFNENDFTLSGGFNVVFLRISSTCC